MREYVEFHNASGAARVSSLVIDTRVLPPELRTSFVLTDLDTLNPLPGGVTGVTGSGTPQSHGHSVSGLLLEWFDKIEDELEHTAGALRHWLGCWVENLGRRLEDEPLKACRWRGRHLPLFVEPIYTVLPSARAEVPGIKLAAGGSAAALISVENRGHLPPGSQYKFHVQQWVGSRLVGGSAYVVRIEGKLARVVAPPQSRLEGEVEEEGNFDGRFLPPWMKDPSEKANDRLGKDQ
jgi:hypothetical protein